MQFITHLKSLLRLTQLPREQRRLVFYSEGKTYWTHLEGIVKTLLNTTNIPICYISSGKDDPGLSLQHPNYQTFLIDEGWVRNWLFENIDTDVMVMTMPDLHQYQVKRSRHPVHYIYVQHSLVSLHMVYRNGAFDHYDTIFCAGPHHIEEMRAIEKQHNLAPKILVEHGYGRLYAIIKTAQARKLQLPPPAGFQGDGKAHTLRVVDHMMSSEMSVQHSQNLKDNRRPHVLIAPSWGPHGLIETMGGLLVNDLLDKGYQVTLRPHPQTVKFAKNTIDEIVKNHKNHPSFVLEVNVASQDSLHLSDVMISDWSGAALDYAFGLEKPVLFIDVPKKINNPTYEVLGIEPLEASIRKIIGDVLETNNLDKLDHALKTLLKKDNKTSTKEAREKYVFHCTSSDEVAANYIEKLL